MTPPTPGVGEEEGGWGMGEARVEGEGAFPRYLIRLSIVKFSNACMQCPAPLNSPPCGALHLV